MIIRYCPVCGAKLDMNSYQMSVYVSNKHTTEQVRWWATCSECKTELDIKEKKEKN